MYAPLTGANLTPQGMAIKMPRINLAMVKISHFLLVKRAIFLLLMEIGCTVATFTVI